MISGIDWVDTPAAGIESSKSPLSSATGCTKNLISHLPAANPAPAATSQELSGLKTKTIQVNNDTKPGSVASVSDLKDLSTTDFGKPKKSKRRNW